MRGSLTADSKKGVWGLIAHSSDLVLAFVVIAIIAMMILPLPLAILDTLVALNIAMGVMLVLMSIYVSSALQFSAFPSVLLISTLFRLALSVATTRMILLEGDAGLIIDTFGQLVAGGNLVVGLVVFLIITLVQFLVIAKGAERVAEVGARFSLDAMPGKQMSIDSDLRSGLIDKSEARRKRAELELESKLHGSMDGAMKFVKGDAIAGIVIIIINLLGGLAIGVFQLDMSAGAAMSKYSILTIGDGMVAQIPALLGAMSAGLIVTRVTDGASDKHLGDSIQKQFSAIPRVLMVAGAMCILFALVPGFPTAIFIGLGFILGAVGAFLVPSFRKRFDEVSQPAFDSVMKRQSRPRQPKGLSQLQPITGSRPLVLEVPYVLAGGGRDLQLQQEVENTMQAHRQAKGVNLPDIQISWHDRDSTTWSLLAHEVPIVDGLCDASTSVDYIIEQSMSALRRNVKLFFGLQEASFLLTKTSADCPDIVKEVLRAVPAQGLSLIMRNLVEEEVPIGNLRAALEGLVQAAQNDKDLFNLSEYARMALARQLCFAYAQDKQLHAISLSASAEEWLTQAVRSSSGKQQLSVDPRELVALKQQISDSIRQYSPRVVIAPAQIRRHVRELIMEEWFEVPVLSYQEIVPPFSMNVLARVDQMKTKPTLQAV